MQAEATGAIWHASPNFGERCDGAGVSLVVIHYTAMETAEAALHRLCDPRVEVSAHYLIAADGRVWQLVREADRAWHAGQGAWCGAADVNSRSIGIELDNPGTGPFAEPLIARLESLLGELMTRHALPPEAVIGHSDMAPDRKFDPGRQFDWQRLARAGLSVWPSPDATAPCPDSARFAADARAFGYPDLDSASLLDAVRQRFRPQASGPLAPEDMAVVADLARRFPVDRGGARA